MHADDGSRYYNDSYNFVVYGGSGSSWGNHKLNIGNWFVYPEHQSDLDALDRDMLSKDPHLPVPLKSRPSGTTHLEVYPGLCGNLVNTDVQQFSGVGERWEGNTCVTMSGGPPLELECDEEGHSVMLATSRNTYRTPHANALVFGCHAGATAEPNQTRTPPPNSTAVPLGVWQTYKNWDGTPREGGSRVLGIPTDAEIIEAAHELLHFGSWKGQ